MGRKLEEVSENLSIRQTGECEASRACRRRPSRMDRLDRLDRLVRGEPQTQRRARIGRRPPSATEDTNHRDPYDLELGIIEPCVSSVTRGRRPCSQRHCPTVRASQRHCGVPVSTASPPDACARSTTRTCAAAVCRPLLVLLLLRRVMRWGTTGRRQAVHRQPAVPRQLRKTVRPHAPARVARPVPRPGPARPNPAASGGDQSSDPAGRGSSGMPVASARASRPPFSSALRSEGQDRCPLRSTSGRSSTVVRRERP